jgi:two-component system response regulator YesN
MIVDDEQLIRRGLRETIDWDLLGLEVAAEASNGEEALELIKKIKPQIIITDVKMPIMDGIQLIKEVDRLEIKTKIIILSGYNEYEYLKEAIKYNVESYLLKPINQEELISIIKSTIINIEKEINIDLQNRQGIQAIRNNTLNRLITNNISISEFKEKSRMFNTTVKNCKYHVLVGIINPYDTEETKIWKQDNYLKLYGVMNICEEILEKDNSIVFTDNNGQVVILLENRDKEELEKLIKEILHKIHKYLSISLVIGVGSATTLNDLHYSYNKVLNSLEYGIITGNENIIYARDNDDVETSEDLNIDYNNMKNLIVSRDSHQLTKYIEEYLTSLSIKKINIDGIRERVIEIVIYITKIMDDILENKAKLNRLKVEYTKLLKINRLDTMIQWLSSYCNNVIDNINKSMNNKGNKLINNVIEYIQENYFKNITLKSLSEIFDINTSYLGQLFKKQVGISYAEYVNQYRVKKAIEYLKDTNLKVYEICEEVGFTNYQYFIKIFKKYTGYTPSDYKK